ncbi:MAG: hypothetical protein GZ094_22475 [Mariniphaga sp.]|nr:hypothetical protein [Mariniphaga sp.]
MKKNLLTNVLLACLFLTFSCGETTTTSKDKLSFEQIGYFKNDSKLRYFTFWVKSDSLIVPNSINEKIFNQIKEHGSKQTNTSGKITASFYYLDKGQTPDVTLLSAQEANDLAHNKKPIAAVWIMPNGEINLIENPE